VQLVVKVDSEKQIYFITFVPYIPFSRSKFSLFLPKTDIFGLIRLHGCDLNLGLSDLPVYRILNQTYVWIVLYCNFTTSKFKNIIQFNKNYSNK
jgi:hypothetical protein